jgi:hypothetical protein
MKSVAFVVVMSLLAAVPLSLLGMLAFFSVIDSGRFADGAIPGIIICIYMICFVSLLVFFSLRARRA